MSGDLGQFFSRIGKAKKEKEDEFRALVGEVDIDSMFSQVKESINEDKKKKKKEEYELRNKVDELTESVSRLETMFRKFLEK